MRFLADENVPRPVIERVRAAGFDVQSVGDMHPGMSDRGVLTLAQSEDRILITEDRDFGELIIRQQFAVRGLVLLQLGRLPTGAEADLVAEVLSRQSGKLSGNLLVIEPGRIRVRPLPQTPLQ